MSPYFELKHFPSSKKNVVEFSSFAATLMNAFRKPNETAHVIYQQHRFIHHLFEGLVGERRFQKYTGVSATLSVEAVEKARALLRKNGIEESDKLVLINPDSSSRFTTIPFEVLSALLKRISKLGCRILLGSGHIDWGTEKRLVDSISTEEKRQVTIVPSSMQLDVYAALIDFSTVFIDGDSGPLHFGAARRYLQDGNTALRNRTTLISIFGATPARIYAYDSKTPGYFPSNQDAPSHAHVSQSPCRNITCINKMAKTCKTTRCFEFVNVDAIVRDIEKALMGST